MKAEKINNIDEIIEERTKELVRQKEAAEQESIAKSDFLASLNHDLRTPLNAVIGLSELMIEEAQAEEREEQLEFLQRINKAGYRLLEMIGNIMDMAKIESGRMKIEPDDVDMRFVLEELKMEAQTLAEENSNKFVVNKSEPLKARIDTSKLKRILMNLIKNACQFTKKGAITLDLEREKKDGIDYMHFILSDTGEGIPAEDLEKIFSGYHKRKKSDTKPASTGLGIPIAKKLAQLMHGDLKIQSELNKGTVCHVFLPLKT